MKTPIRDKEQHFKYLVMCFKNDDENIQRKAHKHLGDTVTIQITRRVGKGKTSRFEMRSLEMGN